MVLMLVLVIVFKIDNRAPANSYYSYHFIKYALPITISDSVWLGTGCIILPSVTISDNCVIGAGNVVTKPIPANCVAVGNPCRVVR
ncbi:hypothetical protein I5F07_00635 [Proteus vulgaris]|uniref:Acetyltransferase n=2 Tax=Morganellaceae TaxID=1903414 RepID=A0A379FE61_PROVU|nr:hypothetical protein EGX81_06845 [Proteus vulgaris]MBI6510153.1 hypothetical protein [Proteus sp. PR00174]NBN46866.1 hypothetical protein [Proteus sp. G2626]NBN60886.1 hypothetical protein [Proteus sp. G2639]NBN76282.1 hypothetical protein [Proteus sp. G2615]NBN86289.1 hypothetical protein [Proteus sp. G2300]